jgi:lysophospholipase L1-like esterase
MSRSNGIIESEAMNKLLHLQAMSAQEQAVIKNHIGATDSTPLTQAAMQAAITDAEGFRLDIEAAAAIGQHYASPPVEDIVFLNDFAALTAPTYGAFPVTGLTFLVKTPAALAPYAGYVERFRVELVNPEVGRKVEFYIIGAGGDVKYTSGLINAESPGVSYYTPNEATTIAVGDAIGVFVGSLNASNGILYGETGGPPVAIGGDYVGRLDQGLSYAFNAQPPQRQFRVGADIEPNVLLVGKMWGNKPRGYAKVDSDGHLALARAAELPWAGKKICWYGTSIPANYGQQSYPAQVGRMLKAVMDNQSVGESGVCWDGVRDGSLSATIAEINAVYPGAGPERSYETKLLGKAADLVVFDHGHNDSLYPAGDINGTDKTTFYGAMNYLIQALYADNPDVKIAFVTPPSRHTTGGSTGLFGTDQARDRVLAIANRWNAPCFDAMKMMSYSAINDALWFPDTVHPSQSATDQIAVALYHWIKSGPASTSQLMASVSWDNLTDRPTTFPPAAHSHDASSLTGTSLASGVTSSSLTSFGSGMVLGIPSSGNLSNCTNIPASRLTGNLSVRGYTETPVTIGNSGTAQTISIANGTALSSTLTANCTFTMPPAEAVKSFTMFLRTGGGGLSAIFTGVDWGDVAYAATTAAGKMDILAFISDGTKWYGTYRKGYSA